MRKRILCGLVLLLGATAAFAESICYSTGVQCRRCDLFSDTTGEYLGYIESCGPLVV
jgi:hypothetical protein